MTSQKRSIPVPRINELGLTCTRCRAAYLLPIDARDVPARCFNCGNDLPYDTIKKLLFELHLTQKALADTPCYAVHVEALIDETRQPC